MDTDTAADVATQPEAEPVVAAAPAVDETPEAAPDMRRFHIPIGVVEGASTSDGRRIKADATFWRDPPLPLMATDRAPHGNMPVTDAQHVGRITAIDRRDVSGEPDRVNGGVYPDGSYAVFGSGEFDMDNPAAAEYARRVHAGHLNSVSADMIAHSMEVLAGEDDDMAGEETMTSVELLGFTIVPHPAFAGCFIVGDDGQGAAMAHPGDLLGMDTDGAPVVAAAPWILHEQPFSPRRCLPCEASGLTASAAPVLPPRAWFDDPQFTEETPLVITDEGQVYGHLALWPTCHIGISGRCVTPPHSMTGYALFNRRPIPTAEGSEVQVGPLTVGTGHADTRPGTGMFATISHYDNTGHAVADVTAGEDEHGIWIAGALRPDATDAQIRALRASSISGDWRDWGGNLELGAVLAVNTPGFPVLKQVVASGRPTALIATGPSPAAVLDEVRALLPDLRDAAAREQRTRDTELAARTSRAEGLRARRLSARRSALHTQLATLTKETA